MKFSLYSKKNQFDEMQEQTMLRIEARGFWLLWAGLLLAILVQIVLRTPSMWNVSLHFPRVRSTPKKSV